MVIMPYKYIIQEKLGFYNVTRWKAQAGTVWGNITFGGDRFIMHAGTSKNLSLGAGLTSNYIILNTTGRTGFGTGISGEHDQCD